MKPRASAVIFDIYGTLLQVVPNAYPAQTFDEIIEEFFPKKTHVCWEAFSRAVEGGIKKRHLRAAAAGVRFPEVDWCSVVREALSEYKLSPTAGVLEDFATEVMLCWRSVRKAPFASEVLEVVFQFAQCWGVASNAQFYTRRELATCFSPDLLRRLSVHRDLVVLSWEMGFSKPAPEFFHKIANALERRGIPREDAVMIGDREDNDILPARAAGFQTWNVGPHGNGTLRDFSLRFGFVEEGK